MSEPKLITVAQGDGIGPEIMDATLKVLHEAKANIKLETIQVGSKMYEQGFTSGLAPEAWDSIHRTKTLLKAPITTPQGGGYKSLNVTLRKSLGLFANVRPSISYAPYVHTHHPEMDMVVVRENEEDLYAGIEHQQTPQVAQSLKLITNKGTERIMRYAFEYAIRNGRKKVTCMSKDNIMKISDGLFHRIYDEVAKDYPQIETEHYIIDIGAARIANAPQLFDVVVTENLYGDIISDIASETSGSVGLAGSANIGKNYAMFEAIHGSAPDIAGQNIANPSGLIQAAVMMLVHIGEAETAAKIQNAWYKTIEDGIHTGDIYDESYSKQRVGTDAFADAVIERLGETPSHFTPAKYEPQPPMDIRTPLSDAESKERALVGVDLFLYDPRDAHAVGPEVEALTGDGLKFHLITNRGLKVWPDPQPNLDYSDHWRCRFYAQEQGGRVTHQQLISLMQRATDAGLDFIKTEQLYTYGDARGFSLAQGE